MTAVEPQRTSHADATTTRFRTDAPAPPRSAPPGTADASNADRQVSGLHPALRIAAGAALIAHPILLVGRDAHLPAPGRRRRDRLRRVSRRRPGDDEPVRGAAPLLVGGVRARGAGDDRPGAAAARGAWPRTSPRSSRRSPRSSSPGCCSGTGTPPRWPGRSRSTRPRRSIMAPDVDLWYSTWLQSGRFVGFVGVPILVAALARAGVVSWWWLMAPRSCRLRRDHRPARCARPARPRRPGRRRRRHVRRRSSRRGHGAPADPAGLLPRPRPRRPPRPDRRPGTTRGDPSGALGAGGVPSRQLVPAQVPGAMKNSRAMLSGSRKEIPVP